MEKVVWASACVNHSRHMAGPAAAAPRVHRRAHGERGLSPRLEAGQPAAGCSEPHSQGKDREWGGAGKACISTPWRMLTFIVPWCRLGYLPPYSRSIVESVSDVPNSHRVSCLSLKLSGSWLPQLRGLFARTGIHPAYAETALFWSREDTVSWQELGAALFSRNLLNPGFRVKSERC